MYNHPVEKDLKTILNDPDFELHPDLTPFFKKEKRFTLEKLLAVLEGTNNSNDAREFAARLLGRIGDPKAIPALLKGVQDTDSEVSWFSGLALVQFADLAVPGLLDILRNSMEERYWNGGITTFLEKIATNASVKTLYLLIPGMIELLHQSHIKKRNAAARIISKIHHPLAIWALVMVVLDTTIDEDRIGEAIDVLASIHAETALIMLLNPIYKHDRHMRIANRLRELNTPNALQAVENWYHT